MKTFYKDNLTIEVCSDRIALGKVAGDTMVGALREFLAEQGTARMIFAAAPSQDETLEALISAEGIDWGKVTAFHMDEYIGLSKDAPQRFSHYLKAHLFDRIPFGTVHLIEGTDPDSICSKYTELLLEAPIDIVCMGIGENGHIAFNDPPVADFNDPKMVKTVDLDLSCRQQQVNDGCFPDLDSVPKQAITLTIPALMQGKRLICSVPGSRKHAAVKRMLEGEISTDSPASILRTHPECTLFLDVEAAGDIFACVH